MIIVEFDSLLKINRLEVVRENLSKIIHTTEKLFQFERDYSVLIRKRLPAEEKPLSSSPGQVCWERGKIIINIDSFKIICNTKIETYDLKRFEIVIRHEFYHLKDALNHKPLFVYLTSGRQLNIISELIWEITIDKRMGLDWQDRLLKHLGESQRGKELSDLFKKNEKKIERLGKLSDSILKSKNTIGEMILKSYKI